LVASLALIFLIFSFIYSLNLITYNAKESKLILPDWSFFEKNIIPRSSNTSANLKSNNSSLKKETFIDSDLKNEIGNTFNILESFFQDSNQNLNTFYSFFSKEGLEDLFNSEFSKVVLDNNERIAYIKKFNLILEDASNSKTFMKIGNPEKRAELLLQLTNSFFKELRSAIVNLKEASKAKKSMAEIKNKEGLVLLSYAGISFLVFLYAVMFLIIFKAENSLRKLSQPEKKND